MNEKYNISHRRIPYASIPRHPRLNLFAKCIRVSYFFEFGEKIIFFEKEILHLSYLPKYSLI